MWKLALSANESVKGPDRSELVALAGERVVSRDRAVLVDPQDLPVRIVQLLSERSVAVVAHREVQRAVRPEPDASADMQQMRCGRGPEELELTVCADVLGRTEPKQVVEQVVPGVLEARRSLGRT
jgi:hypothetical protein